jgi:hypothetical protein
MYYKDFVTGPRAQDLQTWGAFGVDNSTGAGRVSSCWGTPAGPPALLQSTHTASLHQHTCPQAAALPRPTMLAGVHGTKPLTHT